MTDLEHLTDPLKFARHLWPDVVFYSKQREMVYSVRDSVETYVVAGNQLGKDFVGAYIALSFFLNPFMYFPLDYARQVEQTRRGRSDPHTRRVLTTSVKDEHLDILWGEIGRFVRTAKYDLTRGKYPVVMTHHEIRFQWETTAKNPINYLKGQVAAGTEGLSGHHAAYTLLMGDEASGLADEVYKGGLGWMKRGCFFGNPNPAQNFFRSNYEKGDLRAQEAKTVA